MGTSYYPPGHPTGIRRIEDTITCAKCGHAYDITGTYDAAVNYTDIDDATCPKCGHFDGDPVPHEEDEPEADDIPDNARWVEGIGCE